MFKHLAILSVFTFLLIGSVSAASYSESFSYNQPSVQVDKWVYHEDVKGGHKGFTLVHYSTGSQVSYTTSLSTSNLSELPRSSLSNSRFSSVRSYSNDYFGRVGSSSNTNIAQQALKTFQQDSKDYQTYKLAKNQQKYNRYSYSRSYNSWGYGRF